MAGKKSRKRTKRESKRSKKKDPCEKVNERSALNVEEKKPKLAERDEQSPGKQEPNCEILVVDLDSTTSDKVEDFTGDLEAEESKYVPPFSRKAKRILKRNGTPLSPPTRPKRSWRGVQQNLNDTQPSACPLDSGDKHSDVVRNKDRPAPPKNEEDKEEKEIDVVGIEDQILCSQEVEDSSVYSASQTTEEHETMGKDGVISTLKSPPLIVQNETYTIVMQVLDNVVDCVCQMVQCNKGKAVMESEKGSDKSGEADHVHAEALHNTSLDNHVNKDDKEDLTPTKHDSHVNKDDKEDLTPKKRSVDFDVDFAIDVSSSTKTAATGEVANYSLAECSVYSGSPLMAKTRSVDSTASSDDALNITSEDDPQRECGVGDIDHAHATLQSFDKTEKIHYPNGVDNDHMKGNVSGNVPCDLHYVHKREDKPQNPETDNAAFVPPVVKSTVTMTEENEQTDPTSSVIVSSMDTELRSSGFPDDQKPEKNNDQNSGNNIPETVKPVSEDMENDSEVNAFTLMLEQEHGSLFKNVVNDSFQQNEHQGLDKENYLKRKNICALRKADLTAEPSDMNSGETVSSEVPGSSVGENGLNDLSDPNKHQGVDQMVPSNYEHTTVLSQGNPDVVELASKMCSDQGFSTVHGEMETDKTTCMQSSIQVSPTTCKQTIQEVTEPECQKPEEGDKHSALSPSQLTQGFSLFGTDNNITDITDGDIMEFDCVMDCTDSQLVCLDSSADQPPHQNADIRGEDKNEEVAVTNTSQAGQCSVQVPSDNGMVKGLISELSALNKFIMGAWRELENQRKQKQRGLKLSKGKKLK